jgi:hypothetical protein
MKTILTLGFSTGLFAYFFISLYNKTWDIMNFSGDSVYWFGSITAIGFIAGMMISVLGLDKKENQW